MPPQLFFFPSNSKQAFLESHLHKLIPVYMCVHRSQNKKKSIRNVKKIIIYLALEQEEDQNELRIFLFLHHQEFENEKGTEKRHDRSRERERESKHVCEATEPFFLLPLFLAHILAFLLFISSCYFRDLLLLLL